jgi:hypothetical protein
MGTTGEQAEKRRATGEKEKLEKVIERLNSSNFITWMY